MHSRIIQFELEPIDEEDFIDETYIFETTFIGEIADYINDDTNRQEDIDWFVSHLRQYGIKYNKENQTILFEKGFKLIYFKESYANFMKIVNKTNLESFATNSIDIYRLEQLLNEKYGFYIYYDGYPISLDTFVRDYLLEKKEYYIGGTIDYHS